MSSSWRYLRVGALALALTLPMAAPTAATRDEAVGGSAVDGCLARLCTPRCPCAFDRWQDARLLKFGYGMTADREAAAYWYRRAAEKGDFRAAFNYGFMLIHGIGAEADPSEGLRLVRVAAASSIQEAWFELGNLYRLGEHVAIDLPKALDAYRHAAEKGHVRAQHALGNMYGNGQGAGVDLVTASKWWRVAARKGHELAGHAQRLAASMMTSAENGLAKRAAADWLAARKTR